MLAIRRTAILCGLSMIAVAFVGATAVSYGDGQNGNTKAVYPVTYPLYDLPVYRIAKNAEGGFDPRILFAFIRQALPTESWLEGEITAYPQNLSMVVVQTEANHAKLTALLESLRKKRAD
ncbi:MAG TPA: hypothetical protein VGJ16_02555 [Pirellulales bacterium]|jgi:hypothetical protein